MRSSADATAQSRKREGQTSKAESAKGKAQRQPSTTFAFAFSGLSPELSAFRGQCAMLNAQCPISMLGHVGFSRSTRGFLANIFV
jgi:hypothetical protein